MTALNEAHPTYAHARRLADQTVVMFGPGTTLDLDLGQLADLTGRLTERDWNRLGALASIANPIPAIRDQVGDVLRARARSLAALAPYDWLRPL